jgi:DNA-binding transcriptional LysR family regulator
MLLDHVVSPVDDIYLLIVLAQTCSFTQAARQLNLSKASVSTRIADLERATGVPLVRRTTRSVTLTDAGRQLVDDCAPAFERIDAGFVAVKDLSGAPRGVVSVTAPVALGRQHVAPNLARFLRQFPDVRVQLELTDRFVNLTQEGFDLAIRHTSVAPDNYVAWSLCETRSMLVASAGYLRARGEPAHPLDLSNHDCLLYLGGDRVDKWTFLPEKGVGHGESVSVQVRGPLRANNSEVLREAVLDGLGIGLLPDFSTVSSSRTRLITVLPDWRVQGFFGSHIYALRPWSAQVPRAVRCFVDYLRTLFEGGIQNER